MTGRETKKAPIELDRGFFVALRENAAIRLDISREQDTAKVADRLRQPNLLIRKDAGGDRPVDRDQRRPAANEDLPERLGPKEATIGLGDGKITHTRIDGV
jgi:hypothetical protein